MRKINEVIEACSKKWGDFYEIKIDMNEMVRVMDCYDNVLYRCEDFEDLEKFLGLKPVLITEIKTDK